MVAVAPVPMDAALKYAADEAVRVGTSLHLVHVVARLEQGPETVPLVSLDLEGRGRLVLQNSIEYLAQHSSHALSITSELVAGPVVPALVQAANRASTVVLQRRHLSRARRVVTRSISSGVAARSRVPVVSVPERWAPIHSFDDGSTVTVGIDDPRGARPVLEAARDAARLSRARLSVVHVWTLPGDYEQFALTVPERTAWVERAECEVAALLGEVDTTGVEVSLEVTHGPATDVLLEYARESDLLVIGRRDPWMRLPAHLGPVARAVLREAPCPVVLVDVARDDESRTGR